MTAKTALITGAGQGMGRAIALKFAAADIHTVLVGYEPNPSCNRSPRRLGQWAGPPPSRSWI